MSPNNGIRATDRPPPVALLITLTISGIMAINIYTPSMPDIVRSLGTNEAMVQRSVTVFLMAFAVAQLFYGPLSDRFGRRWILVGGLTVFVIANILCAIATTIEFLLFARVLQAIGAACASVLTRAIVRDSYDLKDALRIMSYLAMSSGVAAAIAPTVGGMLQGWFGWRSGFVFLAVVVAIPIATSLFLLRETNQSREAHRGGVGIVFRNYWTLLTSPTFLGYAFSVGAVNGAFFAFITASPFLMVERLGLSPQFFGVIMLYSTGGFLFGTWGAPRLSRYIGLDGTIAFGAIATFIVIAVMLGLGLAENFSINAIMFPVFLIGVTAGFIFPPSAAAAVGLMPHIAGTASAMLGFIQLGMGGLGSLLASTLTHDTQVPVSILMLVISGGGVAALGLIWWGRADQAGNQQALK